MADGSILALDVGAARVGLALASHAARLANPYKTIANNEGIFDTLQQICDAEQVTDLVVGLPRNMSGQATAQTAEVQAFGKRLEQSLHLKVHWQDEAVTSVIAEAELAQRERKYQKQDIDALAATYILEDYLREHV